MAVTLSETTLAAAVQPQDDRIKVASAAGIVLGQMGYAGREAFLFLSLVSPLDPTVFFVTRGYSGTPALSHPAAAKLKFGPQHYFGMYNRAGSGDTNKEIALPWLNVLTGDAFNISTGAWQQVGSGGVAQGSSAWP